MLYSPNNSEDEESLGDEECVWLLIPVAYVFNMVEGLLFEGVVLNGSIVVLITFICGWGYKLYFSYLKDNQKAVNEKIEGEIDNTANNYSNLKKDIGVERFANRLLNYTELKNKVQEGKEAFEKSMIFYSIVIILSGIIYSALYSYDKTSLVQYQTIILIVLGIASFLFLSNFKKLYDSKKHVETFLNGTSIDDLFEEEE